MPHTDVDLPDDPRERLVAAGLRVLDELPLSKAFAGARTAAIAAEAGVTTGSFFHHFANAAEFADALVLSFIEPPADESEVVDELVGSLQHLGYLDVLRTASDRRLAGPCPRRGHRPPVPRTDADVVAPPAAPPAPCRRLLDRR